MVDMKRGHELRAYHRGLLITMHNLGICAPVIWELGRYWLNKQIRLVPSNNEERP